MIFPKPHEYSIGVGRFDIPTHLTVSCNVKEFITAFDFLRLCLSSVYGIDCDLVNADADIEIAKTDVSAESYILEINNSSISIYASDLRGAIYGISSLVQSVIRENSLFIPCAIIKDSPTCQVRGVHFYMPERNKIDEFKRIIDSMALLKMNTVILEVGGAMQYDKHPEINESWVKFCAQIESFPGFNGYKSFQGSDFYWKDSVHTEMAGGYYLTKDEVRDIVTYCKKRGEYCSENATGEGWRRRRCKAERQI